MKKLLLILPIFIAGCVAPNPALRPNTANAAMIDNSQPSTNVPAFVISPSITNLFDSLRVANAASTPVNPYSIPISLLLNLAFGASTLVAGFIAKKKSAEAATQNTAADFFANTISKAGLDKQALDNAVNHPITATLVQHLNNQ